MMLSPTNSPSISWPSGCFHVRVTVTNVFLLLLLLLLLLPWGRSEREERCGFPLSCIDCGLPTELTSLLLAERPETRISLRRGIALSFAFASSLRPIVRVETWALARYGKLPKMGAKF